VERSARTNLVAPQKMSLSGSRRTRIQELLGESGSNSARTAYLRSGSLVSSKTLEASQARDHSDRCCPGGLAFEGSCRGNKNTMRDKA
jgi:hypothetical protein